MPKKLAFVLGIRPDVIRAAFVLRHLRSYPEIDVTFIWSGQHYSDNLKDVFFRELQVTPAEVDLGCRGETDAEIAAAVISRLHDALQEISPEAVVFLGDTNTTTGCIAAAQLNIPIVHIEGGMRSYDWRMPEEKYRTIIDHLADVIYVYFDEYRDQAIREGINPDNVVVVGNPIVDVLDLHYFSGQRRFAALSTAEFFSSRGLQRRGYLLMTCHRRENVHEEKSLQAILDLAAASPLPVYFPASYRTQKVLRELGVQWPASLRIVDPVGYDEFLSLMVNSRGVLTDSGTVVEEACILGIPSVQLRRSTERPQVYDVGSSVKFDPSAPQRYRPSTVYRKLAGLFGKKWDHPFGDGKASQRIAEDLRRRLATDGLQRHRKQDYRIPVERSYREDGLADPLGPMEGAP